LPTDPEAVRQFLEGLPLRALGRVSLHRMVERFGGESLQVLLEDPLRLSEVAGLPPDKALAASEELRFELACRDAAHWMTQFGISTARAEAAAKHFGLAVSDLLRDNPYLLLDPALGTSFAEVDRAALAWGVPADDRRRVEAAVAWLLRRAVDEGHVCLPEPVLLQQTRDLLRVGEPEASTGFSSDTAGDAPPVTFSRCVDTITFLEKFFPARQATPDPACLVYAPEMLVLEKRAAQRLLVLRNIDRHHAFKLSKADWVALETLAPWGWDDGQRKVFADAGAYGVTVVTGGPGTGKTTLLKGLVRLFMDRELEVALTAPTGRAARRMSDATGLEAKTVHRLLEVVGSDPIRFRKGLEDPLEADVVILDEASMLDLPLFTALLEACATGTRLILVGDAEQLPSVGAGRVLGDLIDSGVIPVTRLGQVFRQQDNSLVSRNAQAILRGQTPEFSDEFGEFHLVRRFRNSQIAETVVRLCRDELPERYGFDPLADIQVLSPMRKGTAGITALNAQLREALNPQARGRSAETGVHGGSNTKSVAQKGKASRGSAPVLFREGDRVMQNRNEYRQPWIWQDAGQPPMPGEGVYNGDMGTVVEIDARTRATVVLFDDGRESRYEARQLDGLELAYAVTVHKSQGSEYPVVVLALGAMPDSLACRNLLYTAITRARRMVVIVGSEQTLARMIQNNRNLNRFSGLAFRLAGQFGEPGETENFDASENAAVIAGECP
jgi:exodeoxyribonuclease V alpha subunit